MSDKFFTLWFIFCGLFGLAFFGVIVWAIVELVGWVTAR
jgi:hypothetical protein